LIQQDGFSNIAMVWHVSAYCGATEGAFTNFYPGDQYVDWMGISYFEPQMCATGAAVTNLSPIENVVYYAQEHYKPLMICESSAQAYNIPNSTYSTSLNGSNLETVTGAQIWGTNSIFVQAPGWFGPYFSFIHANSNVIRAACYIDCNWAGYSGAGYWGDAEVQDNATVLADWKSEINTYQAVAGTNFWVTAGACTVLSISSTPVATPTPTPSYTPGPNCETVLADFNNQTAINNYKGNSGVASGSGPVSLNYSAPGYSGGPTDYSLEWTAAIPTGSWAAFWEYTSAVASNTGDGFGGIDISPYSQIVFDAKASPANQVYYVEIGTNQAFSGVNDANWEAPVTVTSTSWMGITVNLQTPPFFNPNNGAGTNVGTFLQNEQECTQIVFAPVSPNGSAVTLWLDNISFTSPASICGGATNTATGTPTRTVTSTSTPTATNTNTVSYTPTLTNTNTNTETNTITNTDTNTVTNTMTSTKTDTETSTATNTPTQPLVTSTFTNTATNTATLPLAVTSTFTNTFTKTESDTVTNTATATFTQTPTNTATNTITGSIPPTNTFTNTATNTSTATSTNTMANTATWTVTDTFTNTATNSVTNTFTATNTVTVTPDPTPITVQILQGPNPPSSSNQLAGVTGIAVLQVVLDNPSGTTVNITGLSLTDSGTGNPTNGISGVALTKNGTSLSTGAFSGSTTNLSFNDNIPADGSVTYFVSVSFSSAGSLGTYKLSLVGANGTNGKEVIFSGLPLSEAIVTIESATSTPTNSATSTATNSPTITNTPTMTSTVTATSSFTSTFTPPPTSTQTCTPTVTATFTPTIPLEPVISAPYPNPSKGSPISFNVEVAFPATVVADVFTLNFRKISSQSLRVSDFQTIQWDLKDIMGVQVANGLYYIRVQVIGIQSSSKTLKVLVLR
jgi:hypothetical protein